MGWHAGHAVSSVLERSGPATQTSRLLRLGPSGIHGGHSAKAPRLPLCFDDCHQCTSQRKARSWQEWNTPARVLFLHVGRACSPLTGPTVPITQPGSGAGHWRTQQGKAAPAESGDGASPTDAWRHWVEINTSATFDYHLILSYHLIRGVARTGRRAASINGTVTFSNQSGHSLMVSLSLGTQG